MAKVNIDKFGTVSKETGEWIFRNFEIREERCTVYDFIRAVADELLKLADAHKDEYMYERPSLPLKYKPLVAHIKQIGES